MTLGGIASIPFWICAGVSLYAMIACPLKREPGETNNQLLYQFFFFLILSGLFMAIAAACVRYL